MIRLAWRQFRVPAIVAASALVVVAAIVLLTHGHVVDVYDAAVEGCAARGDCDQAETVVFETYDALRGWLGILVVALPGLVGVFWGAPLVAREVEQGTFRLAWTQSVTRSRWLAVQLAVGGVASVVFAGLVSLMVTWWSGLYDRVRADAFWSFDQRDVVPMGYALVAFVLGVAAGVFMRRVMPAVATTVVAFIGLRFAVTQWVRPALLTPRSLTVDLDSRRIGFGSTDGGPMTLLPEPPHLPNAWIRTIEVVDDAGRRLTPEKLDSMCPQLDSVLGPPPTGGGDRRGPVRQEVADAFGDCIETVAAQFRTSVTYHPAKRYWTFQWFELGVYVAIAAVLVALCFWGIRRLR